MEVAMNTIVIKKTVVSILVSICLMFCLLQVPDFPHVDQTPAFEKPHSHEIVEVEQFGDVQETNINITRDKKRFVNMELNSNIK